VRDEAVKAPDGQTTLLSTNGSREPASAEAIE